MAQTSISYLCMQALKTQLTKALITDLDDNPDPFGEGQLGLLISGKLFEDPTITKLNMLIRNGGDDWEHTLNVADQTTAFGELAYEMGGNYGGRFFKRRFTIQLKLFYTNEFDQDVMIESSNLILNRAENAIWRVARDQRPIGPDSFGEIAHHVEVNDSWLREGGGPGDFIARGQIDLTFMTQISIVDPMT